MTLKEQAYCFGYSRRTELQTPVHVQMNYNAAHHPLKGTK